MPHWDFITDMAQDLCNDDADTQELCAQLLYAMGGPNEKQLNKVKDTRNCMCVGIKYWFIISSDQMHTSISSS